MKHAIPLLLFAYAAFAQTQSGTAFFYADKFEGGLYGGLCFRQD